MLDMSCGHIILGRPWQWSRMTIHDGFKNTHIVHKGRVTYKLVPLIDNGMKNVVMCFGRDLLVYDQGIPHYDTGWDLEQCHING